MTENDEFCIQMVTSGSQNQTHEQILQGMNFANIITFRQPWFRKKQEIQLN